MSRTIIDINIKPTSVKSLIASLASSVNFTREKKVFILRKECENNIKKLKALICSDLMCVIVIFILFVRQK